MITKNIFMVQTLTKNEVFNVNGFLTCIIDIDYNESSPNVIHLYGDTESTVDTSSPRPNVWLDNVKQKAGIIIREIGKHRIIADLTNIKYLKITKSDMPNSNIRICFTPYITELITDMYTGGTEIIYDVRGKKQLDVNVKKIYEFNNTAKYIRFFKSTDKKTWENFTSVNTEWGITKSNFAAITDIEELNAYANVEETNFVKIKIDSNDYDVYSIRTELHEQIVDGRTFDLVIRGNDKNNISTMASLLKGYRYVRIEFKGTNVHGGYATLSIDTLKEDYPKILDGNYCLPKSPYNIYVTGGYANTEYSKLFVPVIGEACGGAVTIDFNNPLKDGIRFYLSNSSGATVTYGAFKLTLSNTISKKDNAIISEKNDYVIKACKKKLSVSERDVFGTDVIEYTDDTIVYYLFGYNGTAWKYKFNVETVENFVEGEKIKYAYLLPYSINGAVGSLRLPNRIIIFTNKNRILYNCAGNSKIGNMGYFKESKIINPYKKWQAVNSQDKVDTVHKYFPVLKDYNYSQFDNRGADVVQGESAGDLLLDFHTPDDNWRRTTWCNMARSNKVAVFGNYNTSGTEPIVIATVDGGKTWKVVTWLSMVSDYAGITGGKIDLAPISNQKAYVANSLKLCLREYKIPTDTVKEPTSGFVIDENKQVSVSSFTVEGEDTFVNLSTPMDYGNYSPICFFKNNGSPSVWDYICNNEMSESGEENNGIFFRLSKVNDTKYKLSANVGNPYDDGLICYHIHAVNRTNAGFVISTGESYRQGTYGGGMLYFLQMNYNNGDNVIPEGIDYLLDKTFRITSSPDGVNRACGAYISNDKKDPTVIYCSDESFYTTGKRDASIPGRSIKIKNVPTGIFRGKLSDIDNQSEFECVCETRSTVLSLFEWNGHFVADGHFEGICISKDGKNWNIDTNMHDNSINGADSDGNIYFGNCVVEFK